MVDIKMSTILVIGSALRRIVPMIYLAMALYLGLEGSPRKVWNWAYIAAFGVFGVGAYMVLNEPGYSWLPVWATNELWVVVVLVCLLIIGLLLFIAAIELQDLDTPPEAISDFYDWFCRRIFR